MKIIIKLIISDDAMIKIRNSKKIKEYLIQVITAVINNDKQEVEKTICDKETEEFMMVANINSTDESGYSEFRLT